MDKSEILRDLKRTSGNNNLKLPEDMKISSVGGVLSIELTPKGLTENMQTNPSAFEGWALAIKSITPKLAEKVVISWCGKGIDKNLHYNRFLYRIVSFEKNYSWVSIKPLDNEAMNDYQEAQNIKELVVNYPKGEASDDPKHDEARLESSLCKVLGGTSNHQLPVGLFKGRVAKKSTEYTPRQGSQIDMWSLKDNIFSVYELKTDDNKAVGIVSELMFYTNVMKDLVNHRIKFSEDPMVAKINYRDFHKVYEAVNSNQIKEVVGVFLTNKLHPLLAAAKSKGLLNYLNENSSLIRYEHIGYEIEKAKLKELK